MSEHRPNEAGIAQAVPALEISHNQIETPSFLERCRKSIASVCALGAAATALAVGPLGEKPAYAATSQATVNMPFGGKWAYPINVNSPYTDSNSSHPSVHAKTSSGDWATDLYAAAGTDVKLNVSSPGTLSFAWENASGSCGESRRIKVSVNSSPVGTVYLTHLKEAASTTNAPTNGMTIGKIANLACNPGGSAGKHAHVEFNNTASETHSCFTDHGNPGASLGEGTPLGTLGSANAAAQQACATETAGSNPPPPSPSPAPAPLLLNFVRLNHGSGNVQVVSYDEPRDYRSPTLITQTGYPAVPTDGSVVPLFKPNGDLSMVNLQHPSGNVEVVSYSRLDGYKTPTEIRPTPYPSVPGDGAVIPLFQPDGDLSFIRLNHGSGKVEVVAYTQSSGYQTPSEITFTNYPAVETDGSVVPLYWLNGDLVFLRMNHPSGKVELISYSQSSKYQQIVNQQLLPYPAIAPPGMAPDGAVVPMFQLNDGDLSFIRLNHSSGNGEVVTYGVGSNFQTMNDYDISAYPAVPPDGAVLARYSN